MALATMMKERRQGALGSGVRREDGWHEGGEEARVVSH